MTRVITLRDFSRVDALILIVSLTAGAWSAARTANDLEAALGLISPQRNSPGFPLNSLKVLSGIHVETLREKYARTYPRSPLTALNRTPAAAAGWKACTRVWESSLPFLSIAGLGIGFVAIRRPRPASPGARIRWGPGRIAAALSLVLSGAGLVQEFVVRRFDSRQYGCDLESLSKVWENDALCVGTAIAAAWVQLILAGRWKTGRGWRETLGLGLGAILLANLFWATVLKHLAQF